MAEALMSEGEDVFGPIGWEPGEEEAAEGNGHDPHPDRERKQWRVLTLADLDPERHTTTTIEGLIGPGDVMMIYGGQGSLKTQFVLDMLFHIALGRPWFGRELEQGLCYYVAAEGASGVHARAKAVQETLGAPNSTPVRIIEGAVNLMNPDLDVDDFIEQMRPMLSTEEYPCRAIVYDTLSQSMVGGDENAARDHGVVESNLRRIASELASSPPFSAVIHHTGKNDGRGARGSSAPQGNYNVLLHAKVRDREVPIEERQYTVSAEKVKDGSDSQSFSYRAELLEVGTDHRSKPILAPVARPAEFPPEEKTAGTRVTWADRILHAIEVVGKRDGFLPIPETELHNSGYLADRRARKLDPGAPAGVHRSTLLNHLDDLTWDGETERPKHRESVRRVFSKTLTALSSKGKAYISGDFVWL